MNFETICSEISIVAVRSRGPGGQNVNKVSSAAQLFWSFRESKGLTLDEKERIAAALANMINNEQQIYLRSDEFRDLEQNKARALEKLLQHLRKALHKPKARKATRPTKGSVRRRQEGKTKRAEVKQARRKVSWG